jgi:hypothetical protein
MDQRVQTIDAESKSSDDGEQKSEQPLPDAAATNEQKRVGCTHYKRRAKFVVSTERKYTSDECAPF